MGTRTDTLLHPESNNSISNQESQQLQNDLNNGNRMRFESQRLATFISWPATAKVGASKIAKAGFYYTGSYLEVKCKWCGCCIGSWEFGDQVMMRHRTAKPDCPFVLNISDNVPLAPSLQITPQTSQVDSSQSTVDTTDNNTSQTITPTVNEDPTGNSPQQTLEQVSSIENHHTTESLTGQDHEESRNSNSELLSRYYCEEKRFRTYRGWPVDFIEPEDLAKSGFIYSGYDDCVRCVFCLGYVASWEPNDIPELVHAQLFPNCQLVKGLDCGNITMTQERRQEIDVQSLSDAMRGPERSNFDGSVPFVRTDGSAPRPNFNDSVLMELVAGASDFEGSSMGFDETGIRPRVRDLNSGPEKGRSVLTMKDSTKIGEHSEEEMGVIKHTGPAHPKYAALDSRLRTFRDWPPALRQQPQDLAESGFYYIGLSDQVKCFCCDGGLRNWQPEDDPWVEHCRWFSKCSFVRLIKGDVFIGKCMVSKPPEGMPEFSSSTNGLNRISDETLQSLMTSSEVREALSFGIDPTRIKVALKKKWEETGSGFSGSQQLIQAAFRAQRRQEDIANVENLSTQSPFSDNHTATLNTFTAETIAPTAAEEATTCEPLNVASPNEDKKRKFPDASSSADEEHPSTSAKASDLERENRRLKEERTCKICMDKDIGVVFLPCGHLICCFQCAPALTNCPLCRQPIHGTVKTYMS